MALRESTKNYVARWEMWIPTNGKNTNIIRVIVFYFKYIFADALHIY